MCVHRQGESAEGPKKLLFLRLLVTGIVLCIMEICWFRKDIYSRSLASLNHMHLQEKLGDFRMELVILTQ